MTDWTFTHDMRLGHMCDDCGAYRGSETRDNVCDTPGALERLGIAEAAAPAVWRLA